jgi:hypothetical protein
MYFQDGTSGNVLNIFQGDRGHAPGSLIGKQLVYVANGLLIRKSMIRDDEPPVQRPSSW